MNKSPFISIIVPVHNGEKSIGECIESLLDQSYPKDKYEIIVVDNGSRDRTAEIIKRYPVRYVLQNKIQSSYASRNEGVRNAKGDIIAFTDADCIATKDWLERAAPGFSQHDVGCVAGEIEGYMPSNYVEMYLVEKKMLSQTNMMKHRFLPFPQTANALYLKEVFNKIGFFEDRWISGGDADFAWRMQLETSYKVRFAPEALVYHKHRSTVKSMFKQRIKWGIGNTLLYKKYRQHMPRRRLKETYWDLRYLARELIGLRGLFFADKAARTREERKRYLQFISLIGKKLGMLMGSITHGVYYV